MVSMSYAYDKPTMLNAAYDVLEMLSANVQQVNSNKGLIVLKTDNDRTIRMLFEMQYPKKNTEVSFVNAEDTDELGGEDEEFAKVILDEMSTKLSMSYMRGVSA